MADKDLGEGLEKFEEEVENLKNKQFKIFGIKVTAITVSAFLALAGSFVGTLYGGFIVYKDYMDMKEIISNIDTDEIAARNEQIEIRAEVLSLLLKYNGEIGLINSVLKYPILFSLFEVCDTNSLLEIWR